MNNSEKSPPYPQALMSWRDEMMGVAERPPPRPPPPRPPPPLPLPVVGAFSTGKRAPFIVVSCAFSSHCEKQPPSNLIRPEPCERHRREMVRRGYGP